MSLPAPPATSRHGPPFCAIGLDVGGTKLAGGLVAFPDGEILARRTIPTEPGRGGEAVLADALHLAEGLAAEARASGRRLDGIGVGVCELVDLAGDVASANLVAWQGVPVREHFSRLAPAVVEADVRAAALGEALLGAGRPFRIFLYVTVGTGISSCLVQDGRPYAGARGATGTLASSPLDSVCARCGGQSTLTLEQIASGPALVARYNRCHPGRAHSGEDVRAAAAGGDEAALAVLRSAGDALGTAVGLMVNVLDPEAVVMGGGLGSCRGPYWDSLVASTRRHIWSGLHRDLDILPAARGPDAGLIGAAATSWLRASS